MLVVDASCLLELLLQPRNSETIRQRLLLQGQPLCAPQLIDIEVSHVLRRYWLAKELSTERGHDALVDLEDFPLERFGHTALLPRIWQLRNNLTAYDAAYVALAESLDAPLVTCDAKLARSTGHGATIEII